MAIMMAMDQDDNDDNVYDIPHLQLTETPVVWSLPEQWLWSTLFLTMNFGQLFFFTMDFEVTLLYNDGLWSTLFVSFYDNLVLKPAKDVFSHLLVPPYGRLTPPGDFHPNSRKVYGATVLFYTIWYDDEFWANCKSSLTTMTIYASPCLLFSC